MTTACLDYNGDRLACAWGGPVARGRIRVTPEDFVVEEQLGFTPSGAGEHLLVEVRKTGLTTEQVAVHLARQAGLPRARVSFSGMKDRHAVAVQWFSLEVGLTHRPRDADLVGPGIEILASARNRRKLRRGSHRANRFTIRVRDFDVEPTLLDARLNAIAGGGLPNYFGEQRFGARGTNVRDGLRALGRPRLARSRRSIYLSALRAWLFNAVLDERVRRGIWNRALPGDVMVLNGTASWFAVTTTDAEIERRLMEHDIHPSGPLAGVGQAATTGPAAQLEADVMDAFPECCEALQAAGVEVARRALRVCAARLEWTWPAADQLQLGFELPRGAFATTLLRECLRYD